MFAIGGRVFLRLEGNTRGVGEGWRRNQDTGVVDMVPARGEGGGLAADDDMM